MTARESAVDAAFHECLRLRAYAKYAANPEPFAKPPPERHFDAPNITVLRAEVFKGVFGDKICCLRRNALGVFRTYSDFVRTPSTLCALCRLQSHPYESTLTRLILQCFARKFFRGLSGVSFVFSCGTPVVFFELICLDRARTFSTRCAL